MYMRNSLEESRGQIGNRKIQILLLYFNEITALAPQGSYHRGLQPEDKKAESSSSKMPIL